MSSPPDPSPATASAGPTTDRRHAAMPLLRIAFLVVVVGFIWWGVHNRTREVRAAVAGTSAGAVVGALVLVLVGLLCTGLMWRTLLPVRVPVRAALSVFFVGQLGKYLPGSVWTFGAQAQLARRYRVPARTTVAASLVFLGVNLATAVIFGCAVVVCGGGSFDGRGWLFGAAALISLCGLHPALIRWLARKVAGTDFCLGWAKLGRVVGLMTCAWTSYAAATAAVSPSGRPAVIAALTAAMLLAYAAGVVVILAPAGLGAREATFVAVASPVTGFAAAAAVALLSRLVFTAADLIAAGTAWAAARRVDGGASDAASAAAESTGHSAARSLSLKDERGA